MTYKEFLKELKSFEWELIPCCNRQLIRTTEGHCPVVAVFNKKFQMDYSSPLYNKAGRYLELEDVEFIAQAADGWTEHRYPEMSDKLNKVRADLEKVCQIK